MEHEESFDVANLVSTPTDPGLPMSPPPPPPLPLLLPSQMNNTDLAPQSAAAVKLQQDFELPHFTSAPTDVDLVVDYLSPARRRMMMEHLYQMWRQPRTCRALLNADLPSRDPWELPGIAGNNGKRDKYFLTDHPDLIFCGSSNVDLRTPNGSWKTNPNGVNISIIFAGDKEFIGVKKTLKFHPNTGDAALLGTKTNWIMHVYYCRFGQFVQSDLVLCHVLEEDSTDTNGSRKCPKRSHSGVCNGSGNHCGQAFGAPSNTSFNPTHSGPMHPVHQERTTDPILLNSYIEVFKNILLGDPDPDNSADAGNSSARTGVPPTADHGQSKKRKKSSDVWDYFTEIFARDENGKVWTFAGCNHCCKILIGKSTNGTSSLARHTCTCQFKPVETGRKNKASGGNANVLPS